MRRSMVDRTRRACAFIGCLLTLLATVGHTEQKQRLGPYDVHYMVVRSTFFNETIAEQYGIVRGRDRALMNVSILDGDTAVAAAVEGVVINLLDQRIDLDFREIREGSAIYYLAEVKHTDRETLRFVVTITGPDGTPRTLRFQQMMYWDGR
jgi:hypothetical protein